MLKKVLLPLLLIGSLVQASECPQLAGAYLCSSETDSSYVMQIQQLKTKAGDLFTIKNQFNKHTSRTILADNIERSQASFISGAGIGMTFIYIENGKAICSDGYLKIDTLTKINTIDALNVVGTIPTIRTISQHNGLLVMDIQNHSDDINTEITDETNLESTNVQRTICQSIL